MIPRCRKCGRANPPDAVYCFADGTPLDGQAGASRPAGARPFAHALVLASGRRCRTFDELALACHDDWSAGLDLLRQGYLEAFLVGVGRADLAAAARAAARFPDPDRGLDQFLAGLPTTVLQPPRLYVEPREINLGTLAAGAARRFTLHLHNQGMRLLHGTVACDETPWLALGDLPGVAEKHFCFRDELVLPVQVLGQRLRASSQPLEGRLAVSSSGSKITVTVRASMPVTPFPSGVLAGAISPRQLAKQAKAAPRQAAVLFEHGSVAAWYRDNGWTYPIPGPPATGLGAVQQFFEALGLTEPPKVTISTEAVSFIGNPGDRLDYTLEVRAAERRPVYAHAVSDRPWLEVRPVRLHGQVATVPLRVPEVPDAPGQTLLARVTVTANSGQRFVVAVGMAVTAPAALAGGPRLEVVEVLPDDVAEVLPVEEEAPRRRPRKRR
jgi:hypothetical protein